MSCKSKRKTTCCDMVHFFHKFHLLSISPKTYKMKPLHLYNNQRGLVTMRGKKKKENLERSLEQTTDFWTLPLTAISIRDVSFKADFRWLFAIVCIGWIHKSPSIQTGNTEAPYWRPRFPNLAGTALCGALKQDIEVTFLAWWSVKCETSLRKLSFFMSDSPRFQSHFSSPRNKGSILLKYLHICHKNSKWPAQIKARQSPHLQGLKPSLNSLHKHAKPVT